MFQAKETVEFNIFDKNNLPLSSICYQVRLTNEVDYGMWLEVRTLLRLPGTEGPTQ